MSEGAIENPTLTGPILSNSSLVDMSPDSGEGTGNVQSIDKKNRSIKEIKKFISIYIIHVS